MRKEILSPSALAVIGCLKLIITCASKFWITAIQLRTLGSNNCFRFENLKALIALHSFKTKVDNNDRSPLQTVSYGRKLKPSVCSTLTRLTNSDLTNAQMPTQIQPPGIKYAAFVD